MATRVARVGNEATAEGACFAEMDTATNVFFTWIERRKVCLLQRNVFFLQCNVFLLQCKVSPHFVFYEVKPTFRDSDFLHRNLFWLQCKVLGPVMQNIAPQCFFVALVCCTAIFICCPVPCCFSRRQAPLFQEATSTPQWWVLEGFRKSPQGILEGAGGVLLTTMNQVYLASW